MKTLTFISPVGTLPPRLRINCLNPCSVRGYSVVVLTAALVLGLGLADTVEVALVVTGAAVLVVDVV